MNPGIRILPLPRANGIPGGRMNGQKVRATSCPQNGKISLKADEPQVDQRHEDVERNGNTTTLLFSLKRLGILYQETREQVKVIVLYCIKGVVIAAQCTTTFSDLLCSPEFRYYQDVNTPIKFCSEDYFFSGLRFFNESEISDSESPA